MRPVTVTVGPLAAASATNIAASQTIPVGGGTLALNGALAVSTFVGTGSIAGNVLTISAVTFGILNLRNFINGLDISSGTSIQGLLGTTTNGVGTYVVSASQTVPSTTIYGNTIVTLDTPRRIGIVSAGNDSAITFTLTGLDWANTPVSEVVNGANIGVAVSALDYSVIYSIVASGSTAAAVTAGTTAVAGSQWINFDDFATGVVTAQIVAIGTVNYTYQTSGDDPKLNPAAVVWDSTGVAASMVAATTTQTVSGGTPTRWGRIMLNSGSGSVRGTFTQFGVAPY